MAIRWRLSPRRYIQIRKESDLHVLAWTDFSSNLLLAEPRNRCDDQHEPRRRTHRAVHPALRLRRRPRLKLRRLAARTGRNVARNPEWPRRSVHCGRSARTSLPGATRPDPAWSKNRRSYLLLSHLDEA